MDEGVFRKIDNFFSVYPFRRYDKKDVIVYSGEEPEGVYYLLDGLVRQYDISASGEEVVVNIFKPPAFFPMAWAIHRRENNYMFEAIEPVELRIVPREEVVEFIRNNPDVAYDLLKRMYSGVEGLQRRMAHLMGGSSRTRVLFELILESQRYGTQQQDGTILLPSREHELANRSGLSRETINREIRKLKDVQAVSVTAKGVVVNNLQYLKSELGNNL